MTISAELVTALIEVQFPHWAGLPVRPVELSGWDNATFRLGDDMSVRLPTAAWYCDQVDKEHRWLPALAAQLPLPIPEPLAVGGPGPGYPWPWSVRRWIPGQPAVIDGIGDLEDFAASLAEFLLALQAIDPSGGPAAGAATQYRGGTLMVWDSQVEESIASLSQDLDIGRARDVWRAATDAPWPGPPVWFHGDVTAANLLVFDGRLSAVIDFGGVGVGDPACDLAISWTLFEGASRRAFLEALGADDSTRARARGWALWKSLVTHVNTVRLNPEHTPIAGLQYGWRQPAHQIVDDVLADDGL